MVKPNCSSVLGVIKTGTGELHFKPADQTWQQKATAYPQKSKNISSVCNYIIASTLERHAEGSIPSCTVAEPQHSRAVNSPASGDALLTWDRHCKHQHQTQRASAGQGTALEWGSLACSCVQLQMLLHCSQPVPDTTLKILGKVCFTISLLSHRFSVSSFKAN